MSCICDIHQSKWLQINGFNGLLHVHFESLHSCYVQKTFKRHTRYCAKCLSSLHGSSNSGCSTKQTMSSNCIRKVSYVRLALAFFPSHVHCLVEPDCLCVYRVRGPWSLRVLVTARQTQRERKLQRCLLAARRPKCIWPRATLMDEDVVAKRSAFWSA